MNKSLWSLCLMFALFCTGRIVAADETGFAKANQAYNESRFQDAATAYESLVESGQWNANLFYDLGNAYYRLGNFGKAVLNYERALALDPRHPEADANLRLARDEARALELRKDRLEHYAAMATVKQYSVAGAIAFWSAIYLAVHLWLSQRRSAGRIALMLLGIVAAAVCAFAIFTLENGSHGNALAVVTKETDARLATADNAKSVLVLPAGSEITVVSERGGWLYAALPNDQRGWIPANSAERVRL